MVTNNYSQSRSQSFGMAFEYTDETVKNKIKTQIKNMNEECKTNAKKIIKTIGQETERVGLNFTATDIDEYTLSGPGLKGALSNKPGETISGNYTDVFEKVKKVVNDVATDAELDQYNIVNKK